MTSRAYLYGDVPVLGPIGVAVTGISNTAMPAIGADFLRHGILFHNPNIGGPILRVLPVGPALTPGQGAIPIAPLGFFELYDSDGGALGSGDGRVRVNCGWQVAADTAGNFGLTIWNFTDANPAVYQNPPEPVASLNVDVDIASPNAYQTAALTTGSAQLMPANQNRRGVQFGNPGAIYYKGFAPGNLAASIGAGSIVLAPQATKLIRATGKVRVNCAFNAVTQSGADGTATALEFI